MGAFGRSSPVGPIASIPLRASSVGDLRHPATFFRGVGRTLRHGCLPYVLSRPFAHTYRSFRRRLRPPTWMAASRPRIGRIVPASKSGLEAMLKLSVIVVNWNVGELLRDCLLSVYREMRLAPDEWELIVVDNNSSDASVEMIRSEFPSAVVVANSENLGFAKANNQAFEISGGRYVLL